MAYEYTYSRTTDFGDVLYEDVLVSEIQTAALGQAIERVGRDEDVVHVVFAAQLSQADKTTLDGGLTQAEQSPPLAGSILGDHPVAVPTETDNSVTAGSTNPTVNDDSTEGYQVGSRWINTSTNAQFVCLDASVGAAVWVDPGATHVVGPASSTDEAAARFDGTTGKLVQNSSVLINDSGYAGVGVATASNIALRAAGIGLPDYGVNVGGTASFNDYDVGIYTSFSFHSATGDYSITGLANTAQGKVVIIHNVTDYNLTIPHQSLSSAPGNRFDLPNDEDIVVAPNGSISVTYTVQGGGTRWRVNGMPRFNHNEAHESGGIDAIKLDDLATPDDNTDLDASTSRHGLLKKLGGGTTNFLRADGTWASPSAVFGSDYQRAESLGSSTTTGEDQTKVTLTTGAITGTYRIGWGCALLANNKLCEANLYNLTNTTELMNQGAKPTDDNGHWQFAGGVVHLTFSGSSKTLQLRYGNIPTDSENITVKNAWIEIWRVS